MNHDSRTVEVKIKNREYRSCNHYNKFSKVYLYQSKQAALTAISPPPFPPVDVNVRPRNQPHHVGSISIFSATM